MVVCSLTHVRILLVLMVTLLASGAGVLADEGMEDTSGTENSLNLTYYTENLPPYNFEENGRAQGITVDILENISSLSGIPFSRGDVHILPWDDAYRAALSGNQTGLFATARVSDREDLFRWVGPISMEQYVLFAARDSNMMIDSPDDLQDLTIGVITGDASRDLLLEAGVNESQFVTGESPDDLIRMLDDGVIDLWAYPELTGRYYSGKVTGDYDHFDVVNTTGEVGIYYAFSQDVPDITVTSLQAALDTLKKETDPSGISTYDAISEGYVPGRSS